jgi:alpha-glucoside transport system permease protein
VPLQVNGLRLEVVGREITGRPVPGRPRRPAGAYLLGVPAVLLLAVIAVPVVRTAIGAFRTGADRYGFANFGVLEDGSALRAALHTAAWVAVALALVVVGFGIALAGHRAPSLWRVLQPSLTIPFAVSAMVAGAAFRIIFDPTPERGVATSLSTALFGSSPVWLGPGLVWVVLVSAFGWGWLGYVVSLFRAGLEAVPDDLGRTVRAEGLRGWRRLRALELPILRPTYRIIELTLLVAAVRLFDLVLIVAPGPMQADADVLALHWWRTTNSTEDPGRTDALALTLFVVVAGVAVWRMRGLRTPWALPEPARQAPPPVPPARRRALGLAVGLPVSLLWAFPVVVLVLTALHTPAAAGLRGWWSPHGLGFASFGAAATAGLWRALGANVVIAGVATVLVLSASVPAAYLLAWGGLPRRVVRGVVLVLVVLAVTPVQMYAGPLRGATWLAGSPLGLALVHAGAGVPFAVLLLRAAFAAAPPSLVAESLLGPVRQSAALNQVRQGYRPAIIAVAVIELVLVWNDFIVGFLLGGPGATPLSLVLWGEARQFATSAGTVAAAAVVSSIVPVVILLAFWRTVVRGLTIGTRA